MTAFGRLPLAFIENQGQVDAQARFSLRTGGQTLWITHEGIIFDLLRIKGAAERLKPDAVARTPWQNHDQPSSPRLRIPSPSMGEGLGGGEGGNVARERLVFAQDLVGANTSLRIEAQRAQPGTYNYFRGNDPAQWRTGVRGYAEVSYREVWEGIDLRLYGNGQALEQEFIVKPGVDLSQIRVAYRGIEGLRVAEDGALLIQTAFGELRESKPRIYQEIDGKRVAVDGRFKLLGENAYTFEVGSYQRQYALVIDPTLVWSTYLGGGQTGPLGGGPNDVGHGIAVDAHGDVYITGSTQAIDFPTMVPFQGTFPSTSSITAFITKLNATGSALIYSTFLGNRSHGTGITVDTSGRAYVTGWLESETGGSVPLTTGAAETTPGAYESGFVTKLSPDGSQLKYSTYSAFGSSNVSRGIAIDPDGNAYITGDTNGRSSAWARKLNPTGTAYLYSKLIGGTHQLGGAELAGGIAVDADRNAYVVGSTSSGDFPTTPGALQTTLQTTGSIGAFVVKLGPTGGTVYSTLLVGDYSDNGTGVAVDVSGHAYVTGYTISSNFPTTPGALQTTRQGTFDAFVTKLKADGSGLVYSTRLGGKSGVRSSVPESLAYGVAVDPAGNAHVTGYTSVDDFPVTTDAFQSTHPNPGAEVFVTKLNATGSGLLYSTYLGALSDDQGLAIALDTIGDSYVTGLTFAPDFPMVGGFFPAFQQVYAGGSDAFVAKFSTGTPTAFSLSAILPGAGGDTGSVTTSIQGSGFTDGATVKLVRSGKADIVADAVSVAADGRTVTATFDLTGKARGAWDVVVTNPDGTSETLAGAFTIKEGRAAHVWVDILGRDQRHSQRLTSPRFPSLQKLIPRRLCPSFLWRFLQVS